MKCIEPTKMCARSDLNYCTPTSLMSFCQRIFGAIAKVSYQTFLHTKYAKKKNPLRERRCAVDSKTSWKVQKTSKWVYQRGEGLRKPTQQKTIPDSSLFEKSSVTLFQHGVLVSFSIYPWHKTYNIAKRYKHVVIQLSWRVQLSWQELWIE